MQNMCTEDKKCCQNRWNTVTFFENKTGLKQGGSLSPILFNLALQKVIQSVKMVLSGIKIGKEQLSVLPYADNIILIGKNEVEIRHLFVEI